MCITNMQVLHLIPRSWLAVVFIDHVIGTHTPMQYMNHAESCIYIIGVCRPLACLDPWGVMLSRLIPTAKNWFIVFCICICTSCNLVSDFKSRCQSIYPTMLQTSSYYWHATVFVYIIRLYRATKSFLL